MVISIWGMRWSIINQDQVIAILDFEETSENLFLIDLALTIMAICVSTNEHVIDMKLVRETIYGYQSIRSLSKAEKDLLPEAINYSAKAWIKWFRDNHYEKYAKKHEDRLKSFAGL